MSWTKWRLIAKHGHWFEDVLDFDGPTCYELSIAGPRGGDRGIVYCGHTRNEKRRMSDYGRDGSHLADIIQSHLKDGWYLYYRGWSHDSVEEATEMEKRMLKKSDYDWNLQLNS